MQRDMAGAMKLPSPSLCKKGNKNGPKKKHLLTYRARSLRRSGRVSALNHERSFTVCLCKMCRHAEMTPVTMHIYLLSICSVLMCLCRCFTFGIGQNACRRLVQGLATVSKGTAEFLAEGERLQPKVLISSFGYHSS